MKLSVIIPTVEERKQQVADLIVELCRQGVDEIILVEDSRGKRTGCAFLGGFMGAVRYFWTNHSKFAGIGSIERNIGTEMATGEILTFLDDDDQVGPDYVKTVKEKSILQRGSSGWVLNLFRINHPGVGGVIWKDKSIRHCNISTQMIVVPNTKTLPKWTTEIYESDLRFAMDCVQQCGDVEWHEEVIATHNGAFNA